jgi:hypothetical protein
MAERRKNKVVFRSIKGKIRPIRFAGPESAKKKSKFSTGEKVGKAATIVGSAGASVGFGGLAVAGMFTTPILRKAGSGMRLKNFVKAAKIASPSKKLVVGGLAISGLGRILSLSLSKKKRK